MSGRGFSPATVAAYEKGGATLLMAAFQVPNTRRATLLVPPKERAQVFNQMTKDGLRPDSVSVLNSGGHPLFTEVWVPRTGLYEGRVFTKRQDFEDVRQAHQNDGYTITDLVPFRLAKETRYAVIWVK